LSEPILIYPNFEDEDNQNHIALTERLINYYNRQIKFIKENSDDIKIIKYFHKSIINIKLNIIKKWHPITQNNG